MRILIITHPRSGGMSLTQFISSTLNSEKENEYQMYHEPFFDNQNSLTDKDINEKLLVNENIIVKDFPYNILLRGFNLTNVISKFDKVIVHQRDNHEDVAISLTYMQENGIDKIHKTHQINDEWLKDNEDKIKKMLFNIEEMFNSIKNIKNEDYLRTTYDGIYNDKTDVPKLLKFLNITNSRYLDMLDNRHRLRNGDVGMDNYYIKPLPRKLI